MAKHKPAEHESAEKKHTHPKGKGKSEYEKMKHAQEEAFGKFDENVEPAEGEMTYQQYLAMRPAGSENSVVHTDGKLRTVNGKFASQDAYEAQFKTDEDVAREKDEKPRKKITVTRPEGEPDPPNYKKMGFMQLVIAAADAQTRNDKADLKEIELIIGKNSKRDAKEDSMLDDEEAKAYVDDEFARFQSTVKHLIEIRELGDAKKAEKKTHVAKKAVAAVVDTPEAEPAETTTEKPEKKEVLTERKELYYDDIKIEIARTPKGFEHMKIKGKNGEENAVAIKFIDENDPKYMMMMYVAESDIEHRTISPDTPEPVPDEEVVVDLGKIEHHEGVASKPDFVTQKEPDEAEKSRLDRMKRWFNKELVYFQHFGGKAYWKGRVEPAIKGVPDLILHIGVNDTLSQEERERKIKRNATIAGIGVGALATAALFGAAYGAYKFGHSLGEQASQDANAEGALPDSLNGFGTSAPSSSVVTASGETAPITAPDVAPALVAVAVPEVGTYPLEAFNIQAGQGGQELFTNLNINPAEWAAHKQELLSKFPGDFYSAGKYGNGTDDVRISHTGWLSPGAQAYLRELAQR